MWGNVQLSPFNTKPLFEWEFQQKFEVVVHSLCCLIKVRKLLVEYSVLVLFYVLTFLLTDRRRFNGFISEYDQI